MRIPLGPPLEDQGFPDGCTEMFPEEHAGLPELGRLFDLTSKLSHPSICALAERVRTVKTDSGVEVKFQYFPVDEDRREPARTFITAPFSGSLRRIALRERRALRAPVAMG